MSPCVHLTTAIPTFREVYNAIAPIVKHGTEHEISQKMEVIVGRGFSRDIQLTNSQGL